NAIIKYFDTAVNSFHCVPLSFSASDATGIFDIWQGQYRQAARSNIIAFRSMMAPPQCGTTPMGHPQPSQLQTTSTSCPTSPRLPGLRTVSCIRYSPTASTTEILATTYRPTSTPISAPLPKRNPGEQVPLPMQDTRTAPYFSAVTCKASTRNLAT